MFKTKMRFITPGYAYVSLLFLFNPARAFQDTIKTRDVQTLLTEYPHALLTNLEQSIAFLNRDH